MKRIMSLAFSLGCIVCLGLNVVSADTNTNVSYQPDGNKLNAVFQYTTIQPNEKYQFKGKIKYQGKGYHLARNPTVTYDVVSTEPEKKEKQFSETIKTEHLVSEYVPDTYEIEYQGKTYELPLEDVSYTQMDTKKAITGTTGYGFSVAQPADIPQEKRLEYEDEAGKLQSVSGKLTGVTKGKSYWKSGFPIEAKYYGDPDVRYYQFGNTKIPNTGSGVPYIGYETEILESLGLSPNLTQIEQAEWSGDYKQENGTTVRYASFSCRRYGADYTAHYTAEIPEYAAEATYSDTFSLETGNTLYTISAKVTYVKDSIVPVVIGISLILIIVLLLILWLLFVAKRKRKKKEEPEKGELE